jgi:hypothetical protein
MVKMEATQNQKQKPGIETVQAQGPRVYVIQIHDEDSVVLKTKRGQFEVYNGPGFTEFGSADVAEVLANALGVHVETLDGTEIAEKTPDTWTWPDVESETIYEHENDPCKHCADAAYYPENCAGCEFYEPIEDAHKEIKRRAQALD